MQYPFQLLFSCQSRLVTITSRLESFTKMAAIQAVSCAKCPEFGVGMHFAEALVLFLNCDTRRYVMKTKLISSLPVVALIGTFALAGCSTTSVAPEDEVDSDVSSNVSANENSDFDQPDGMQAANEKPELEPVLIVQKATLLFEFDSAQLTEESAVKLLKLMSDSNISELENSVVEVEGHADAIGSDQYNQALSEDRAETVMDFMKAHMYSKQWKMKAYGETKPVASNALDVGREQNRRVVVEVIASNQPIAMK